MKVTDEELNRAMAQACGWIRGKLRIRRMDLTDTVADEWCWVRPSELGGAWVEATGEERESIDAIRYPDYCTDRNTTEEIWTLLRSRETGVWTNYLRCLMCFGNLTYAGIGEAVSASPRRHVECALLALNAWPEGREMPK